MPTRRRDQARTRAAPHHDISQHRATRPVGSWRLRWSFRKQGRSKGDQEARRRGGVVCSVSAAEWTHAAAGLGPVRSYGARRKFQCSQRRSSRFEILDRNVWLVAKFSRCPFPKGYCKRPQLIAPQNPASWGFFCRRQNPSFGAPGHPQKQIGTPHSNAARLKKRRAALVQPREGNAKSRLSLVSISRAKVSCRIARGADFRAQLKPALWCFVFAGRRGRGQEHYYAFGRQKERPNGT